MIIVGIGATVLIFGLVGVIAVAMAEIADLSEK